MIVLECVVKSDGQKEFSIIVMAYGKDTGICDTNYTPSVAFSS